MEKGFTGKISQFLFNKTHFYSYSHCTLTENPDGSCELEVPEALRGDAGGYRCVATNDYG